MLFLGVRWGSGVTIRSGTSQEQAVSWFERWQLPGRLKFRALIKSQRLTYTLEAEKTLISRLMSTLQGITHLYARF